MTEKDRVLTQDQLDQIEREVLAAKARPLHKLPESWWSESTAYFMSQWLERNVAGEDRLTFSYGHQAA